MQTTIDANHQTRTLIEGKCKCGQRFQLWLRPDDARQCWDCSEADDRKRNGWTPFNSID